MQTESVQVTTGLEYELRHDLLKYEFALQVSCTSYQECGFYLLKVRDLEWVAMTCS